MKNGDRVVPRLNRVVEAFDKSDLPVFFTRDWHPPNHISFVSQGGPWPPHCVQGSRGAEFHPSLRIPQSATIISKGDKPRFEAYSGFTGTDLEERLKALDVDEVLIGGLTTDYCVKESSLEALRAGFAVNVLEDCVMPVNVRPGDGARALREMRKEGAKLATSRTAIKRAAGARQ